jgi:tetratricopeptide (TPR) repeat protein
MAYHHGSYSHWYHGDWHDHYHWDHPWHYGPVAWFSFGFVAGAVVWDTPWRWGYWSYYNPYYYPTVVVGGEPPIDYSQPIVLAKTPPGANPTLADQRAAQFLDAAHDAFARGDYAAAMAQTNGAIAAKPNDTVPHEFRALVLFATRRYKEAAGAVYAVLSVGPGWDWATLAGCYPDINLYTAQLRALEQYRNDHPSMAEAHFLLAYHYMSCAHIEAAIGEFRQVVQLSPRDQLSAQLLTALTQQQNPADTKPSLTSAAPEAPAAPVNAAGLVGNWGATRSDGASFSLELSKDGTYSWRHTMQGQAQSYSGAYTVADNLLILKEGGNPAMIGQVVQSDPNRFNFKMVGNNPADPGLDFAKR